MIIRINAQGKVVVVCGGVLVQGTTIGNEIYFEAPITAAATCNVYFTLPNGKHVGPFYATSSHQDHELGLNTWYLSVDAAITQYAGELNVHADFMQGSDVVATADCYTTVRRGPYRPSLVLPDNSEQYLEAFSKAYADGASAFLNLLTVIGADSIRLWHAWECDGIGDFYYTTSRSPDVGDTVYYFFPDIGSFQALASPVAVADGDIIEICSTAGIPMTCRYSEGDNRVEIVKNEDAPDGTVLKRLDELNVNAVRFSNVASAADKPGVVYGGKSYGIQITDGRVDVAPLTAASIQSLRNLSDEGAFRQTVALSAPLTLGNYRYAMRRAAVDASVWLERPLSQFKEYYLGPAPQLSLSFPRTALKGDRVYLQWISGSAPTVLTIDESNTNAIDFEPLPAHVCEIQGVYGIIGYDYSAKEVRYGWNLVARQSPMEVL